MARIGFTARFFVIYFRYFLAQRVTLHQIQRVQFCMHAISTVSAAGYHAARPQPPNAAAAEPLQFRFDGVFK